MATSTKVNVLPSTMNTWLHAALPMAFDTETTVKAQAIEAIEAVIFSPLANTSLVLTFSLCNIEVPLITK